MVIPRNKVTKDHTVKQKVWNINKADGWKKYKEVTGNNNTLKAINDNNSEDPTEYYTKLENEREKCKYQSFGKVTFKPDRTLLKETSDLIERKKQIIENRNTDSTDSEILKEIDDKIIKSVKIHHKNKLEKEFNKLENTLKTKGKSSAVFQLKNTIVGNKIKSQEQAAIECPESKKVITDTNEIKSHTENYYVNLLKGNQLTQIILN